ncbi:MAG: flippase-like domain-containing protein [Acidobacteriota bacterium]|nr:flippase-like domain-containing protein [Acidobacteriota bacterium]
MSMRSPGGRAPRPRGVSLRYLAGVVIGVAVLAALFSQRGDLRGVSHEFSHLSPAWSGASILAELASILSFAYLQRVVLESGATTMGLGRLLAISLANNAIANTVPGEPAVSSAYRYREYRRRGASAAAASWTILTIIIAQAIGLSLLVLLGVVVSLLSGSRATSTGVAVTGLVVVLAAGAVLVRRDVLIRVLEGVVQFLRRASGRPSGRLGERLVTTLQRMKEIRLGVADTLTVVTLATLVWSLDFACLLCAFAAVHAPIPGDGVLLAYGVAQIVAVLPLVPGGIGLVEGSLAVILVAYGAARVPTLSTVLVYRFVNYWLAVAVGWLAFAALALVPTRRGEDVTLARDTEES